MSKKHPGGRPLGSDTFSPEILPWVEQMVRSGLTDEQLAVALGVSPHTIYNWKRTHKSFLQTIKEGKVDANGKVRRSLFERACGYYHPEVHITNYQGVITETEIMKHYPPDSTACIFWLKNRGSTNPETGKDEEWTDKQEVVHRLPDVPPILEVRIVK